MRRLILDDHDAWALACGGFTFANGTTYDIGALRDFWGQL